MIKKSLITTFILLFLYHFFAVYFLYKSSYLNVVSFYTHPPCKGGIELRRLPLLGGDKIALGILKSKNDEAETLISNGEIGMAAILSSYQHNQALSKEDAKYRSMRVAELFIEAGYNLSKCESDGMSTAFALQKWGFLDEEIERFLKKNTGSEDIFFCH